MLVSFVVGAAAFAPMPAALNRPVLAAPHVAAVAPIQLRLSPSTLEEEREESVKAAGIAVVAGGLMALPGKMTSLLAAHATTAQWEFSTIALAIQLALFGIVYRCTVRSDDNEYLKQGAVGAAALCRALLTTHVDKKLGPDMWLQIGACFGESILAFGGAAAMLEFAWTRGWGSRLSAQGLPHPVTGVPEYHIDPPQFYGDGYGYDSYGPSNYMGGSGYRGNFGETQNYDIRRVRNRARMSPYGGGSYDRPDAEARRMRRDGYMPRERMGVGRY